MHEKLSNLFSSHKKKIKLSLKGNAGHNNLFASSVFDSIALVPEKNWDEIAKGNDLYFQRDYLKAIEDTHNTQMRFKYLILYKEKQAVAIAYMQLLNFNLGNLKIFTPTKCHFMGMFSMGGCVEKKPSLFKSAACGNMFISGGNGYCIKQGENRQEVFQQLLKAIPQAIKTDEWEDSNVLTLIKDLPPLFYDEKYIVKPFQQLAMEPIMQLYIRENWFSFEDYLNDLTTKYRTKAKSAYKKSESLKCVDLNESDIRKYIKELSALYETVEQKAEFRFAALNLQSFIQLKKLYKKQFVVQAYFLENKLVGFLSAFHNNDTLDANYVGIDYDLNHQYAIYPRMLYDYIQLAIERRVKILSYGRTASEIKSTVGAVPVEANCFINYGGLLTSRLVKNFVEGVELPQWEQRIPFKKTVLEAA